jgi:hypothetical protein
VGGNGDQGAGYAVELELPDTPRIVVDPARPAVELEAGATGTQPLTIEAVLCIQSNHPVAPTVEVPVTVIEDDPDPEPPGSATRRSSGCSRVR